MSEELKTVKTIREYPINRKSPFGTPKKPKNYLTQDKNLCVNIIPNKKKSNSRNLTGIHKLNKDQAVELMGDILKDKLEITKGGINMFKYLFTQLEKSDDEYNMTFKVDFTKSRDDIGYKSTQSVWYALAELLDKNIIARSAVPGVYFLNPNFFLPTDSIVVTEFYKLID